MERDNVLKNFYWLMLALEIASIWVVYALGWPTVGLVLLTLATLPIDWGTSFYIGNFCLTLISPGFILMDCIGYIIPMGRMALYSFQSLQTLVLASVHMTAICILPVSIDLYRRLVVLTMFFVFALACSCPSQPLCAAVFVIFVLKAGTYAEVDVVMKQMGIYRRGGYGNRQLANPIETEMSVIVSYCLILNFIGSFLNIVRKAWGVLGLEFVCPVIFKSSHKHYRNVGWPVLIIHFFVSWFYMIWLDEWGYKDVQRKQRPPADLMWRTWLSWIE